LADRRTPPDALGHRREEAVLADDKQSPRVDGLHCLVAFYTVKYIMLHEELCAIGAAMTAVP